jgi:GT2 family glycosyltransferase
VLLLNEDSELEPGTTMALHAALDERPEAAVAGATLLSPDGEQQPSAWRFPGPSSALLTALWLHKRFVVQSRGRSVREVDWVQSAALLVRRDAAEAVGYFDPTFFVYSDEVDFCKRLRDAGWAVIYVPEARAVCHEPADLEGRRGIVELSRNRDRYMRKHHSASAARAVRWLTAYTYAMRAVAALFLPGHEARRYVRHVRATLAPGHGEGLAEGAAEYNRGGRRL